MNNEEDSLPSEKPNDIEIVEAWERALLGSPSEYPSIVSIETKDGDISDVNISDLMGKGLKGAQISSEKGDIEDIDIREITAELDTHTQKQALYKLGNLKSNIRMKQSSQEVDEEEVKTTYDWFHRNIPTIAATLTSINLVSKLI